MVVVFRCDASIEIGTGHVMRCLTLATALTKAGNTCRFICKQHSGNMIDVIRLKGFQVHELTLQENVLAVEYTLALVHAHWLGGTQLEDAQACVSYLKEVDCSWLIVDHYAIDTIWEDLVRPYCCKVMVIDDLADRQHNCDILLDQNLGRQDKDYKHLVPMTCQLLLGINYCLLREQFLINKKLDAAKLSTASTSVLLYFGGTDPLKLTMQLLALIPDNLKQKYNFVIVSSKKNENINSIINQCHLDGHEYYVDVQDMVSIFKRCQVAIVSCGFICYELAAMGVPAGYFAASNIQEQIAKILDKRGVGFYVDYIEFIASIEIALPQLIDKLIKLSPNSFNNFQKDGVSNVIEQLKDV